MLLKSTFLLSALTLGRDIGFLTVEPVAQSNGKYQEDLSVSKINGLLYAFSYKVRYSAIT